MAPIDAEFANSNLKPLFFVGTHATLIAGLFAVISRFIYRAHRETPPALHTRRKHALHRWGVLTFTLLTGLSLVVTVYHALAWRYASYVHWASTSSSGGVVPGTLWDGWYANVLKREREGSVLDTLGVSGWQLGRWMDDTDLVAETNAAAIENARGFWWTYQNFVGLIVWSVFAGIEGRHRHVPTLITLSFVLLAQLASLSTAQNLFFILLLLTPMPLGSNNSTTPTLVPYHSILSVPALTSFIILGSLPFLTKHSLFPSLTSLGYFVLPHLLAALAQPNSLHRESRYKTAATARKSYEDVFRVLALGSIALHGFYTFRALADEAPPHQYFKHNFVWNSHQPPSTTDLKTTSERVWTTFVTIMSALSENPVIGQVGWDVLLSGLSLCIWTVAHGVDVITMLRCSCLAWTLPRPHIPTLDQENAAKRRTADAISELKDEITVTALGSPTKRGRGRPRKTSAAIARDHVSSTSSSSTALRRSTRASTVDQDDELGSVDGEYVPTKATGQTVDAWDVDEHEFGDGEVVKETEAAALGWGLFVLGGLGAVSASVLGAETSGR